MQLSMIFREPMPFLYNLFLSSKGYILFFNDMWAYLVAISVDFFFNTFEAAFA